MEFVQIFGPDDPQWEGGKNWGLAVLAGSDGVPKRISKATMLKGLIKAPRGEGYH
eukprot:gene52953-59804_t